MATETRDRILAALRALLAEGGTDAVTLEAVAARAGVSKGGLLYHFPSKAALYTGLLERVRETVTSEMAVATSRSGAARGFLEYSTPTHDDEAGFFTSLIAAVRTGQSRDWGSHGPEGRAADTRAADGRAAEGRGAEDGDGAEKDPAGELLADTFRAWEDPMRAAVPDPVQAETIRLVGFGLYLAELAGLPPVDPTILGRVFDRVLEGASG